MTKRRKNTNNRSIDIAWQAIFGKYNIHEHDFNKNPYGISAEKIKRACQKFKQTAAKEVRILCKQDSRDSRPVVFQENNLFLLPVKNGFYKIIKAEGYIDIPNIDSPIEIYKSDFYFLLESSEVGDSEIQYLDYAYAVSLIRHFMEDSSLVLTIRGRKYTPEFNFKVGGFIVNTESVQTKVDGGYEGKNKIILVEAKNSKTTNTIIRQLYYPYRQWSLSTSKNISVVFFEKRVIDDKNIYHLWEFCFKDKDDYNSIYLSRSKRYSIATPKI